MRIVAGTARGRRLVTPAGDEVRPTTDRVRESVFNALGSMGAVVGASVLDLFAGSGALGIEALSRGASSATFVDSSSAATRAITENLRATGLDGIAKVVRSDAWSYLAGGGGGGVARPRLGPPVPGPPGGGRGAPRAGFGGG